MRKILLALLAVAPFLGYSQYPATQTIGSQRTIVVSKGALKADSGYVNAIYTDTLAANASAIRKYPGAQIIAGSVLYMRNDLATGWTPVGSGASGDSIKLWLAAKTDSIKLHEGIYQDTLFEFRDSAAYIRGYIDKTDGLIYGGKVTWSGQGLRFNISQAAYRIKGKRYEYAGGYVDLANPVGGLNRFDAIYLDTTSHAGVRQGEYAAQPSIPVLDATQQLYLTSILVNPSGTPALNEIIIYDENDPSEWSASIAGGTGNTAAMMNPYWGGYHVRGIVPGMPGSRDAFAVRFTGAFVSWDAVDRMTLFTSLASVYPGNDHTDQIYFIFYHNGIQSGYWSYAPETEGAYLETIITPDMVLNRKQGFDRIDVIYTAQGGSEIDIDYFRLQGGFYDGGSPTAGDYVTSVYKSADSVYIKRGGVDVFAFIDSTGDLGNYYTKPETDSIIDLVAVRDITWSVLDSAKNSSSTTQGDRFLVAPNATGNFAGHDNEIATYDTTAGWQFQSASNGDLLYNTANFNTYKWNGSAWVLRPPLPVNNWWRTSLPGTGWPNATYAATSANTPSPFFAHNGSSIAIGKQVFNYSKRFGSDNIGIGNVVLHHNNGNRNIGIGTYVLWYDGSGHDQIAIGYHAAGTGNKKYSISLGTEAKNADRQLSISDSTNAMYFKLKTPAGPDTIPDYLIGRRSNGQWFSYPASGGTIGGNYIPLGEKGQPYGVPDLDATGKVPTSQLPALTVNQPSYVQTLAAMLALSASVGDIVVVGDSSKSYALMTLPASTFGNWLEIQSPVPDNTDLVPEGSVNKYYTDARARAALSAGSGISYDNSTGVITKKKPDWAAALGTDEEILNKPTIPTAISQLVHDYSDTTLISQIVSDSLANFNLTTYATKIELGDSVLMLKNLIANAGGGDVLYYQLDSTANELRGEFPSVTGKVNYSDTTSMLWPYLRSVDTTNKWLPIGTPIPNVNGKVNYTDTSTMLLPYLRKTDTVNLVNKTAFADSIQMVKGMISNAGGGDVMYYQLDSTANDIRGNLADTSALLRSLIPDISNKVNYSDTIPMLAPYLRKVDTTGKWLPASTPIPNITGKVNYTDTANMLLPYLRKTDTLNKWLPIGTIIPDVSGKVNYSDTAAMLAYLASKTNLADSVALLRGLISSAGGEVTYASIDSLKLSIDSLKTPDTLFTEGALHVKFDPNTGSQTLSVDTANQYQAGVLKPTDWMTFDAKATINDASSSNATTYSSSKIHQLFAIDSTVLHKTGNETATGNKTFQGTLSVANSSNATLESTFATSGSGELYVKPYNGFTYYNTSGVENQFYLMDYTRTGNSYTGLNGKGLLIKQNGVDTMKLAFNQPSFMFSKLGLGNNSPTEQLDVTGNIKASGQFIGSAAGLTGFKTVGGQSILGVGDIPTGGGGGGVGDVTYIQLDSAANNLKDTINRIAQPYDYVIKRIGASHFVSYPSDKSRDTIKRQYAADIIQATIDSIQVSTAGGSMFLSSGEYDIYKQIHLTGIANATHNHQISIIGNGRSTKFKNFTTDSVVFLISNSMSVIIKNMSADMGEDAGEFIKSVHTGANHETSIPFGTIENIHIFSLSQKHPAIYLTNFFGVTMNAVSIYGTSYTNMILENNSASTNYGNSTFNHVSVKTPDDDNYYGLLITSVNTRPLNILQFNNLVIGGVNGWGQTKGTGLKIHNCSYNTFSYSDIEYGYTSVELSGWSTANKFLSGYWMPTINGAIVGANSSANQFNVFMETLDDQTQLISDSIPSWFMPNKYDIQVGSQAEPTNIYFAEPSRVYLTLAKNSTSLSYQEIENLRVKGELHVNTTNAVGEGFLKRDAVGKVVYRTNAQVASDLGVTGGGGGTGIAPRLLVNRLYNQNITLSFSDTSSLVVFDGTADTVFIPTYSSVAFPIGTHMNFMNTGMGDVYIHTTSGTVVVQGTNNKEYKLTKKFSVATLINLFQDEWVLIGDFEEVP